jgi:hypothetical protein
MISSMAKGIQTLHSTVEMFTKYEKIDISEYELITGREPSDDLIMEADKANILYNWAKNHKTCIHLNGGTSPDLQELRDFLDDTTNPYPWAEFYEDESLGNLMTAISIVLPEKIYETVSAMKTGVLTFNGEFLHCVDTTQLDPEMTSKLMSFGKFNQFEQKLIMSMGNYRLAQ